MDDKAGSGIPVPNIPDDIEDPRYLLAKDSKQTFVDDPKIPLNIYYSLGSAHKYQKAIFGAELLDFYPLLDWVERSLMWQHGADDRGMKRQREIHQDLFPPNCRTEPEKKRTIRDKILGRNKD